MPEGVSCLFGSAQTRRLFREQAVPLPGSLDAFSHGGCNVSVSSARNRAKAQGARKHLRRHLGTWHPEGDIAAVARDVGADLDQLLTEAG